VTVTNNILSPCIDICDLDETRQWCIGCGRTIGEIARWASTTEHERREIMAKLPERLSHLNKNASMSKR
jgi:hypothetical protein